MLQGIDAISTGRVGDGQRVALAVFPEVIEDRALIGRCVCSIITKKDVITSAAHHSVVAVSGVYAIGKTCANNAVVSVTAVNSVGSTRTALVNHVVFIATSDWLFDDFCQGADF